MTKPINTLPELKAALQKRLDFEKEHGPGSSMRLSRNTGNGVEPAGEMTILDAIRSKLVKIALKAKENESPENLQAQVDPRLFAARELAKKILDLKFLLRELFYQPVDSLESLLSLLQELCDECEQEITKAKELVAQGKMATKLDYTDLGYPDPD